MSGWPDEPPHPARPVVSRQTWRDIVFLHWPCPPQTVRPLLPPGSEPELWDGVAWIGVVGLRMTEVRPPWLPSPPYLGSFGEVNVRTYTVGADGRSGTAFLAMEADRLAMPLAARPSLRLPYAWSSVRFERDRGRVGYRVRRRWPAPRGAGLAFEVRPGPPHERTDLDRFWVNRWTLHGAWFSGRLLSVPFAHERWPLRSARLLHFADRGLFQAAGLPVPAEPPVSVLYAPVVHARMGVPEVRGPVPAPG